MNNTVDCPNCGTPNPVKALHYKCFDCGAPLKQNSNPEPKPSYEDKRRDTAPPPSSADDHRTQIVGNNYQEAPVKDGSTVAAKLLLHTDNKAPEVFNLYIGDNYFGTPAHGHSVDIQIKNDRYVSRCHAKITVKKDVLDRFWFILKDDGSRRGSKGASTNGTFINGIPTRIRAHEEVYLKDGDNIQVGETNLRFKTLLDNPRAMTRAIKNEFDTHVTRTVNLRNQ